MSLQTAGQAAQAQPQTYIDSGAVANPGTGSTPPYFSGYNGAAYPPANGQANTYARAEYAYAQEGKNVYQNGGGVPPNSKYHAMYQDAERQQQNCISAMMSSRDISTLNDQRIRTNSMGQVGSQVNREPESRLRANSHDPAEEMRIRASLQEQKQKLRSLEQQQHLQHQQHIMQQHATLQSNNKNMSQMNLQPSQYSHPRNSIPPPQPVPGQKTPAKMPIHSNLQHPLAVPPISQIEIIRTSPDNMQTCQSLSPIKQKGLIAQQLLQSAGSPSKLLSPDKKINDPIVLDNESVTNLTDLIEQRRAIPHKQMLQRMISAPEDMDMNFHMQRRYTCSDGAQHQAAAKHALQIVNNKKNLSSSASSLSPSLVEQRANSPNRCFTPSPPDAEVSPRKPTDSTPLETDKYVRPDELQEEGAPVQREHQSTTFHSRLDSMISKYDNQSCEEKKSPHHSPRSTSKSPIRIRLEDELKPSTDNNSPSSLHATPVKEMPNEAINASFYSHPRPLNYELSSPKATIDQFRYPSSGEPLTPPSDEEDLIDSHGLMDSPQAYKLQIDQNGKEQFYCHLCDYIGIEKNEFNLHMNTHFEHACTQCDYMSRTEGRLKRHIKDFHSESLMENAPVARSTTPNTILEGNEKSLNSTKMSPDSMINSHNGGLPLSNAFMPPLNGMHLLEGKRENGRQKLFRCRHCEFCSSTKIGFWEHSRTHIKDDKILQCPKCPFVTEYKHHLEYHLRNHFGSKPFRCNKCNYACVNKSMLNSHMKSHTNVYQYRCADCTYATKYCHSLKLHLRKYQHRPATVLNADGSLPIDGSGDFDLVSKRGPPRGPRGLRRDSMTSQPDRITPVGMPPSQSMGIPHDINSMAAAAVSAMFSGSHPPGPPLSSGSNAQNKSSLPPLSNGSNNTLINPNFWALMGSQNSLNGLLPPGMSILPQSNNTASQLPVQTMKAFDNNSINGLPPSSHIMRPPIMPNMCDLQERPKVPSSAMMMIPNNSASEHHLQCSLCGISTENKDMLSLHMVKCHSMENHDLLGMFGIPTETINCEDKESSVVSNHQQVAKLLQQKIPNKNNLVKVKSEVEILDLTSKRIYDGASPLKRKLSTCSNMSDSTLIDQVNCNPTIGRKRSRKGKAYKLDAMERLKDHGDDSANEEDELDRRPASVGASNILSVPSNGIIDKHIEHASRDMESFRPRSKSFGVMPIHKNLMGLKQEKIPEDEIQMSNSLTPVTATVAPLIPTKIDASQAYSQGMSRRKLFMMQQMQHMTTEDNIDLDLKEAEDSDITSNPSTQYAKQSNQSDSSASKLTYECQHCDIVFKDCVMYTMHMGYHGFHDPLKCNMCGYLSSDKVDFFLHIARVAHA